MMKRLAQILARPYMTRIGRRLEAASHDPYPAQAAALRKLIQLCGGSVIGRRFGLDRLRGTEDARKLPVMDYSALSEEIAQARKQGVAASGLFSSSPLQAFALTSGTTAEPKFLPVSRAFFASYRRASLSAQASFFYTSGEWEHLFEGKIITLTARPEVSRSESGMVEGFMSGMMVLNAPSYQRKLFLPSKELLQLPSWDEKLARILDEARGEDVGTISGIPPMVAAFSEVALERFGVGALSEVWPNLRMMLFAGSTVSEARKPFFRKLWGVEKLHFWELYATTEGQFGHSFHAQWPGMVFNPFENFYQFEEEGSGPGGSRGLLQLHELEAGKRYLLHVTTPAGLINYRMGDWIEILSVKPLTFRVVGREKEELSVAGEKIVPYQLERAVERAQLALGLPSLEYATWAREGMPNQMVWALAAPGLEPQAIPQLLEVLDSSLRSVNAGYEMFRVNDFIYGAPQARLLPLEVFKAYHARNLNKGQFKPKRIFKSEEAFRAALGLS